MAYIFVPTAPMDDGILSKTYTNAKIKIHTEHLFHLLLEKRTSYFKKE
jgi:hypothetical protein